MPVPAAPDAVPRRRRRTAAAASGAARTDPDALAARSDPGAVAARDSILGAARAEFSAKGLTGARVDQIARSAGVNKQLIYYYFGSKDRLYRTTLEIVYAEIRSLERALELDDLAPDEAMAALVGFSFDYLLEHPDFIGLLNHENAGGAAHVRDSPAIREANSPLIAQIGSTLRRGVRQGLFRRGIDPVALYISIAGMSYFFFSNRLTLSSIFGRDLGERQMVSAYRRHVVQMAIAGIRALQPNG